ncbi:MAG: hypothetical protein OP8BY_1163 [Candidatus Saccharicenans subterraneus]|uniref:Uncharacterized protein n=1 Tax=Candidatus Saccharicenans subterraneus TaxID=2508984 RepID=A0A3E2BJP3_9BACT|nr:MAG: hypothetical protein OP8BY_1163 [Candidatus Saccharicenans subterraneum]
MGLATGAGFVNSLVQKIRPFIQGQSITKPLPYAPLPLDARS